MLSLPHLKSKKVTRETYEVECCSLDRVYCTRAGQMVLAVVKGDAIVLSVAVRLFISF